MFGRERSNCDDAMTKSVFGSIVACISCIALWKSEAKPNPETVRETLTAYCTMVRLPVRGADSIVVLSKSLTLTVANATFTRNETKFKSIIRKKNEKEGTESIYVVGEPLTWIAPISNVSTSPKPSIIGDFPPGSFDKSESLGIKIVYGRKCKGQRVSFSKTHYIDSWVDAQSDPRGQFFVEEVRDGKVVFQQLLTYSNVPSSDDKKLFDMPANTKIKRVSRIEFDDKVSQTLIEGHLGPDWKSFIRR